MVAPLTMQRIREYAELILQGIEDDVHTDTLPALVDHVDALAEVAGRQEVGNDLLRATAPESKATPASIVEYAFEQLLRYAANGTRSSSSGYALRLRYQTKAWAEFVRFLRDSGAAFELK